ncbi:MAG: cytochrome ubiquinol oxidase subunit I, partial [Geminicoccaceae bacterium]
MCDIVHSSEGVMFGFDAIELARLQFAFTVSAHIFFPAFTIGLASYLAVLNGMWLVTRDDAYLRVFDYWKTIFAVAFGMGVVSGIVMAYQFGTNWSRFLDIARPGIGPQIGVLVLSGLFDEAGGSGG